VAAHGSGPVAACDEYHAGHLRSRDSAAAGCYHPPVRDAPCGWRRVIGRPPAGRSRRCVLPLAGTCPRVGWKIDAACRGVAHKVSSGGSPPQASRPAVAGRKRWPSGRRPGRVWKGSGAGVDPLPARRPAVHRRWC